MNSFVHLGVNVAMVALMEGEEMGQRGREVTQSVTNPMNSGKRKITSMTLT